MEEKAWKLHEALQQLLQGNHCTLGYQQQQQNDLTLDPHQHDAYSFSHSSTSTDERGRAKGRSHVRRCLKQLDLVVDEVLEELTTESSVVVSEESSSLSSQQPSDVLPTSPRPVMFLVLTEVDLYDLGIFQEDHTIHELYQNVCSKAEECLEQHLVIDGLLEPGEGSALLNRIMVLFINDPFQTSPPEEMELICILFRFLNQALFGHCVEDREDRIDDDGTCLERVAGGGVHILEFLMHFLPPAKRCLDKPWTSQPQEKLQSSLLTFVHFLFQHVQQDMNLSQISDLHEYLRATAMACDSYSDEESFPEAVDESQVDHRADKILRLINDFALELLEYTFDELDTATGQCASLSSDGSENDDQFTTINDVSGIMNKMAEYASFAHTALSLTGGFLRDGESTTRSLWISYAKFFLAAKSSDIPEDTIGFATEVFIQLGILASKGTVDENSGIVVLDEEHEHALSVTFLAALEFPDMLLGHEELLNVIEVASEGNSELRHLVQGVALRGLILPTGGTARQPNAMEKVLISLIQIGRAGASIHEDEEEDPWDCFFREEIAMRGEQAKTQVEMFEEEAEGHEVLADEYTL